MNRAPNAETTIATALLAIAGQQVRPEPARTAVAMILRCGARAEMNAERVAVQCLSKGDTHATAWLVEVIGAISELGRMERRSTDTIH